MEGATRAGVLVVAALLLAGCTVGPSQRPPVVVRGDNMAAPAATPTETAPAQPELPDPRPQRPTIAFVDCTDDTLATLRDPLPAWRALRIDCGTLAVPSEPDERGSPEIGIAVIRVGPADSTLDQPPLLVVGDTAVEAGARAAVQTAATVSPEVLANFTIIGMDRRGAGNDLLDCAPTDVRAALVDADPTRTDEPTLTRLLEQARDVVQECNRALDGGLSTYRSAATSSDIDAVRGALGVDRISVIGTGDGAAAVSRWLRAAPAAVARVVLDGPPQPALDDPGRTEARARATEAAFDAFATVCRSRAAGCALGPDSRGVVTALVKALQAQPLTVADGRRLTAGALLLALRLGLSEPRTWPALADALAAAAGGQAQPLLDTLDPVLGPRGSFDTQLATLCNDSGRRFSPGQVAESAQRMRESYPLFGGALALQLLACAPWPAGSATPGPVAPVPPPPVLVIGTAADPRSTLDGARRAAEEIPGAQFVSWQGAGTGAYPRTPCIAGVIDTMLLNGVLPEQSALCPP